MSATDVYFNSVPLGEIIRVDIYNLEVNNLPEYEIRKYKIARADKTVVTSKEAIEKQITIQAKLCGTRSEVEITLALLKLATLDINGLLQVENAGTQLTYTATLTEIDHHWAGPTMMVDMIFMASTPYGAQPLQTVALPNLTAAQENFTLSGLSVPPIRPLITITYNTITGGTSKMVTIKNANTQQGISVEGTFVSGDVLSIDSMNFVVMHNGSVIDFTGMFPTFNTSLGAIFVPEVAVEYSDTFTTRDADGSFVYNVSL